METMLMRLSSVHHERCELESFLEWLHEKHEMDVVIDLHDRKILDEYFGIDRSQLERERRQLLNEQRVANGIAPDKESTP